MISSFGLPEVTVQKLKEIFKRHPQIRSVVLYGSRAKGTHKTGSDIDLTLHAPELTLSDLLKIETEIDDLLLPYQVDLSLYHQIANEELKAHIQRVGKQFYP